MRRASEFVQAYDAALAPALRHMNGKAGIKIVWFEWGKTMCQIADDGTPGTERCARAISGDDAAAATALRRSGRAFLVG